MFDHPWDGVFAATLCPFNEDYSIDESGLRAYSRNLASVDGMKGLVCNGHTGEVMGLRAHERAEVTGIMADEVGRKVKIVSGICAEGSFEAIDHTFAAKEAGADAILLMPCHHWLRFGRTSETAVGYFRDVATETEMPIIVHQYPNWTKGTYTLEEMIEIAKIPEVVAIKMGSRDFSRLENEYRVLKQEVPDVPHLTCHDEYLLASLLVGSDGALVGFAGFVPELIIALVHNALAGNYVEAKEIQEVVHQLNKVVYRLGEPSSDAHQRMKVAMTLQGRFPSMTVRPPLRPLPDHEITRIRNELAESGFDAWYAEHGYTTGEPVLA
ncbi:dihydrodipicolinate synthase family protein [Chloroflexi bacterium TSY]|nr:dihydrodipicolinate synthase family protein [Chloroflexi bacterium TSY]